VISTHNLPLFLTIAVIMMKSQFKKNVLKILRIFYRLSHLSLPEDILKFMESVSCAFLKV
jgi:hypothetical protein